MTCKTCKDERREDTCGADEVGDACPCCGMVIVAKADEEGNDVILDE